MKIIVYTAPNCTYCEQAKALLNSLNLPYEELDAREHKEYIKGVLNVTRFTVPQIWIDGEHVGGFTNLEARFRKCQSQNTFHS